MTSIDTPTAGRLRTLNLVFGGAHLISAIAMIALANDFSLPITTTFLDGIPGGDVDPGRLDNAFGVRLAWATAAFMGLSAFFHLLIASPLAFGAYLRELQAGRNRFRWVEYSLSASLMVVLIALLSGISDAAAVVAIAGVNASMILFGWLMEVANAEERRARGEVWWSPFWFGCVAGIMPWLAIGIYLFGPGEGVPGFVYGIFFSLFVFFNTFALNQWLQYRGNGRWADYLHGERVYIWLSLIAKSLLAWQIFANTLV